MTAPPARSRHFVDLTPLRASPAFARLWIGATVSGIGAQMTILAVGLHVYSLTHSTFAVGLVSGIALVPMIAAGLYGGVLADAFDRRAVLIWSSIAAWASTAGLVAFAFVDVEVHDAIGVWPLYVLTTVNAVATTITGATRTSAYRRLLDPELVPAASALNGITMGVQLTVGPAVAGALVPLVGFGPTYAVDVALFTASFVGVWTLPRLAPLGEAMRPGLESLRSGLRFLRGAPTIRTSFLVDIIAMSFGRLQAIFPAVGALAIGGGATTVGILVTAGAVGTLLSSVFSGRVSHVRRQGVAVAWSIVVYGAFSGLFGVIVLAMTTGWFGRVTSDFAHVNWAALVLAVITQAGMGASDNVSSIFRNTMLLTAAPDHMQGRLQGVFTVVVTGGPRIGDLYMGGLAAITALWFPPVLGAVLIIVLIGIVMRVQRSFREYDAAHPTL